MHVCNSFDPGPPDELDIRTTRSRPLEPDLDLIPDTEEELEETRTHSVLGKKFEHHLKVCVTEELAEAGKHVLTVLKRAVELDAWQESEKVFIGRWKPGGEDGESARVVRWYQRRAVREMLYGAH